MVDSLVSSVPVESKASTVLNLCGQLFAKYMELRHLDSSFLWPLQNPDRSQRRDQLFGLNCFYQTLNQEAEHKGVGIPNMSPFGPGDSKWFETALVCQSAVLPPLKEVQRVTDAWFELHQSEFPPRSPAQEDMVRVMQHLLSNKIRKPMLVWRSDHLHLQAKTWNDASFMKRCFQDIESELRPLAAVLKTEQKGSEIVISLSLTGQDLENAVRFVDIAILNAIPDWSGSVVPHPDVDIVPHAQYVHMCLMTLCDGLSPISVVPRNYVASKIKIPTHELKRRKRTPFVMRYWSRPADHHVQYVYEVLMRHDEEYTRFGRVIIEISPVQQVREGIVVQKGRSQSLTQKQDKQAKKSQAQSNSQSQAKKPQAQATKPQAQATKPQAQSQVKQAMPQAPSNQSQATKPQATKPQAQSQAKQAAPQAQSQAKQAAPQAQSQAKQAAPQAQSQAKQAAPQAPSKQSQAKVSQAFQASQAQVFQGFQASRASNPQSKQSQAQHAEQASSASNPQVKSQSSRQRQEQN
jgi:hypothetical protein